VSHPGLPTYAISVPRQLAAAEPVVSDSIWPKAVCAADRARAQGGEQASKASGRASSSMKRKDFIAFSSAGKDSADQAVI